MKMTTVVWVNDFVHLSENFSERGNFGDKGLKKKILVINRMQNFFVRSVQFWKQSWLEAQ